MNDGSGRDTDGIEENARVQERQAVRRRLAVRAAERAEELNRERRPLVEPQLEMYASPPPRSFSKRVGSSSIGIGLVLICAAAVVYAGGKAVFSGAAEPREKQFATVNTESISGETVSLDRASETEGVALCDLNMQSQAVAQSAYRSAWSWRIERRDGILAVRRAFSVRNLYGVDASGEYTCLLDQATNRIMGLEYETGGLTVTVPGSDLQQ